MAAMTEQQQKEQIVALLRERVKYEQDGKTDRVEQVNESLRALGHKASAPRVRAETRSASRDAELR